MEKFDEALLKIISRPPLSPSFPANVARITYLHKVYGGERIAAKCRSLPNAPVLRQVCTYRVLRKYHLVRLKLSRKGSNNLM